MAMRKESFDNWDYYCAMKQRGIDYYASKNAAAKASSSRGQPALAPWQGRDSSSMSGLEDSRHTTDLLAEMFGTPNHEGK